MRCGTHGCLQITGPEKMMTFLLKNQTYPAISKGAPSKYWFNQHVSVSIIFDSMAIYTSYFLRITCTTWAQKSIGLHFLPRTDHPQCWYPGLVHLGGTPSVGVLHEGQETQPGFSRGSTQCKPDKIESFTRPFQKCGVKRRQNLRIHDQHWRN